MASATAEQVPASEQRSVPFLLAPLDKMVYRFIHLKNKT